MVWYKKPETAAVTFGMIALTFTVCNKKDQHVPFLARLLNNEMAGRNSGRADPGFRDDLWIDMKGSPISSAATMTERMSRPSYGKLNVDITIDDPKMYTKPWTVHFEQEIMLDTELIDEICLENEKSWQHMQ